MSNRTIRTVAVLAAAMLLVAAGIVRASTPLVPGVPHIAPPDSASARVMHLRQVDADIAFWGEKLAEDSSSAIVRGMLAALHAQQAREGGRFEDWMEAERWARESLVRRAHRNGPAAGTLISALLAQHRFADAFAVADTLVRREPGVTQYRAALGEVAMELGRYDVARTMFEGSWKKRDDVAVAPRLARWLELTGDVRSARRILTRATRQALHGDELTPDGKAWLALRLGELEARADRPRSARDAFLAGLHVAPDDIRLHTAMARLAVEEGEWGRAIEWGESAVAIRLDPEPLIILAQAARAAGDTETVNESEGALRALASMQSGPPHRSWSLYRLDHGMDVDAILREAEKDLATRADVYGYDLVAWALHAKGRDDEARAMLAKALALGTREPLLARHAAALGVALPESAN